MAAPSRCAICGRFFRPDVRSRRHQRYCSRRCRGRAKRLRDCAHKQRYRETGLGREQRRREHERLHWATYMRYWRKADPARTARQERERAQRYYERHREAIRRKRRERHAARQALRKACSH